jgi:hypothetical protein
MDIKNFGIVLEAETTDCTIEIYLNDIPVGLCGIGGSRALSRPIHEYLLDGENELGVLVNPGDTPALARYFSRQSMPAFGAQPPPDPAMDAFNEFRREEERKARLAAAKSRENGKDDSPNGDKNNKEDEGGTGGEKSTLSFSVRLMLYPVGVIAGAADGETLMSLEWNASDSSEILHTLNPAFPLAEENAVGPQIFPIWLSTKKDLGEMFGAWHWLNAKTQTLDEKTVRDVRDFVMRIRDLIEEGNAEPILAISTEMYREVAAAYDISAEERANMFRQVLSEESQKPYWIFETPEEEDFSFRLCASNRLIECIGPDWKPIIRGVPSPQGRFLYPMLIGKLNGEWLIMR